MTDRGTDVASSGHRVRWQWEQPRSTDRPSDSIPVAWVPGPAISAHWRTLVLRGVRRLVAHPMAWRAARRAGYSIRQLVRLTLWRESLVANGFQAVVEAEGHPWLPRLAFGRVSAPEERPWDESECAAVIITQDRREKLLLAITLIREHLCQNVVVVDGGSIDGSVAAARQAGAVVVSRPFDRDFAAQRNCGVRQARASFGATWIFRVDDDEQVGPESSRAVKAAIARGGRADAVFVPVVTNGPELWDLDVHFVALAHRAHRAWRGRVHERLACRRPVFLPHTIRPLVNQKSIEEVWRAILLYEDIRPGSYDAGVILGCRQALTEYEARVADVKEGI